MAKRSGFEVRGLSALAANFHAADEVLHEEVRGAVDRARTETHDIAEQLAPKASGFMADHIRDEESEGGLTYSVGFDPADFKAAGLEFYPPYVEFGTENNPAQPFLLPAGEIVRPHFEADVREALQRAASRAQRTVRM